jgi:hypothetical protein
MGSLWHRAPDTASNFRVTRHYPTAPKAGALGTPRLAWWQIPRLEIRSYSLRRSTCSTPQTTVTLASLQILAFEPSIEVDWQASQVFKEWIRSSWCLSFSAEENLCSTNIASPPWSLPSNAVRTFIYFVRAGESRPVKGLSWSLLTLLAGWWGIPWGPIYTVLSLWVNMRGGHDLTVHSKDRVESHH